MARAYNTIDGGGHILEQLDLSGSSRDHSASLRSLGYPSPSRR